MPLMLGEARFQDPVTLLTEGSSNDHAVTKAYADHPAKVAQTEYYLDATSGDDSNSGESGSPIQTLEELLSRLRYDAGFTKVYLAAGTYVTPDKSGALVDERNVLRSHDVLFEGEVIEDESFIVASSSGNVVTVQGSPGWAVNEHVGKFVRWLAFPSFPEFLLSFKVLANTADTLTLAMTASDLGGQFPQPANGDEMYFGTLGAIITNPASDSSASHLHVLNRASFFNVRFSGSVNPMQIAIEAQGRTASMKLYWCEFDNLGGRAISSVTASLNGCHFKTCQNAIAVRDSMDSNSDCTFEDISISCYKFTRGFGFCNFGSYGWAKDVAVYMELQEGAVFADYSKGYYLDNVDYLAKLDSHSLYRHEVTNPFVGYDATKRDLNSSVIFAQRHFNQVHFKDSGSFQVGPDAQFFSLNGQTFALADYVSDGQNAEFPGFNRVIG